MSPMIPASCLHCSNEFWIEPKHPNSQFAIVKRCPNCQTPKNKMSLKEK